MPMVFGSLALVVLAGLALVVGVLWLVGRGTRARQASIDRVLTPTTPTETLRYHVAAGQDPAAVLSELALVDLPAALVEENGDRVIVIECPRGRVHDRGEAREAVARAGTTIQDPARPGTTVWFEDERHVSGRSERTS